MLRRPLALLAALWLSACGTANFDLPGTGGGDGYARLHPYYAEFCALSEIKKKPSAGAEIRGGIGGHAVFYLHGACRVEGAGYPVLQVCPGEAPADGVGLSMNQHFRNAKWVATPGRTFFYEGAAPGAAGLTQTAYERTQAEAKRLGIYDGIEFHGAAYAAMPPGWSRRDWQYEVSASTDYAVGMGRGRYCARVAATPAQMERMVAFLNGQNAMHRAGPAFQWSVFRDNCIHLAHNALAAAGFWDEWPTNQPVLLAMLSFPVPRNEFVNVVRRANAALPADPMTVFRDPAARRALLEFGVLPTAPGALASSHPPQRPNAVYDTDVGLIFFDDPVVGAYQGWFDRIFATPRFHDMDANEAHFTTAYASALARRRPLSWWRAAHREGASAEFAAVYERFYALVERGAAVRRVASAGG